MTCVGKGVELPGTGRSWIWLSLTVMKTTHHTPKFQAVELMALVVKHAEPKRQPPGAGDTKGRTERGT